MRRRDMLLGASGLLLPALIAEKGEGNGMEPQGRVLFSVMRDGSRIGEHELRFKQSGPELEVDIAIELVVKVVFVTAYRYEHHNRERWRDGRLMGFTSRTNDNGERHRVRADRQDDIIRVEGSDGVIEAPGDTLPTTYWKRRMVQDERWIDTQHGRIVESRVEPRGEETVGLPRGKGEAARYALRGDLDLDLWYRGEGWVSLAFEAEDGSRITYRLEEAPRGWTDPA